MRRPLQALLATCLLGAGPAAIAQRPDPATVEGRVVDVLGDPIPAAEVRALVHGTAVARGHADGEGIYRLRLPAGGAEVRVTAPGRAEVRLPWRGLASPRVRNVVLEDAVTLRGHVRDQHGAPVAHAAVVVLPARLDALTAIADERGAYELSGVPLRPLRVRAVGERGWCEATAHPLADSELDLTLRDQQRMCLVHVGGLPPDAAADAAVHVYGPDLAAVFDGGRLPLRADGTATLVLRRTCLVAAALSGFDVAPAVQYVSPDVRQLEFRVAGRARARPTSRLRGTVRTTTDRAVGGVRVLVRDRSHRDLGSVVVDRDGSFELRVDHPPDGFVRYGLALDEWMLAHDELSLADGHAWLPFPYAGDDAQIVVERTGTVRGVLRSPSGAGLALADVVAVDVHDASRRELRAHTDLTGNLALALPAGEHQVLVVAHDGAVCRARVDVEPGTTIEGTWERLATGTLAGTLLDRAGAPVPAVELFVRRGPVAERGERDHCRIVSDRAGRFRCRGLTPGEWQVTPVNDDRFAAAVVTVVAGAETAATLACDH